PRSEEHGVSAEADQERDGRLDVRELEQDHRVLRVAEDAQSERGQPAEQAGSPAHALRRPLRWLRRGWVLTGLPVRAKGRVTGRRGQRVRRLLLRPIEGILHRELVLLIPLRRYG